MNNDQDNFISVLDLKNSKTADFLTKMQTETSQLKSKSFANTPTIAQNRSPKTNTKLSQTNLMLSKNMNQAKTQRLHQASMNSFQEKVLTLMQHQAGSSGVAHAASSILAANSKTARISPKEHASKHYNHQNSTSAHTSRQQFATSNGAPKFVNGSYSQHK